MFRASRSVVLPFCLHSVLRGSHTKERGMSVVLQPFLLQVSLSTKYTNHQFQTKRASVFGYLFSENKKLKKGHVMMMMMMMMIPLLKCQDCNSGV